MFLRGKKPVHRCSGQPDGKHLIPVTASNAQRRMPKRVSACDANKPQPRCSGSVSLSVKSGRFVTSGLNVQFCTNRVVTPTTERLRNTTAAGLGAHDPSGSAHLTRNGPQ